MNRVIRQYGKRTVIYITGMLFVSLGIVLCVKCRLGISPVSSVPYVLSCILPVSFGTLTMLFHLANTIASYIMERQWMNRKVFLQVPIAFLFGIMIDFLKRWLNVQVANWWLCVLLLVMSIVFTAFGMLLMIETDLIQNPPDGCVRLLSERTGIQLGRVKIIYDFGMTALSAVISLLCLKRIEGLGVATVLSAFFVGKVLTWMKRKITIGKI